MTENYGSKMRFKREELGLTQAQVAERAGISDQYYGQIERGVHSPSLDLTTKIAQSLETSIHWILNDRAEVLEDRVTKETERLQAVFKNAPVNKRQALDGLIVQAARLKVLLDDNWRDIAENGEYELFSQSDKQRPYERKRPIVDAYDKRDKNYQEIMKQLTELLPAETHEKNNRRNMLRGG